ncbi:hypothetical protein BH09BAC4_BH09BAC4_23520 [soil metagenome]
MENPIENRTFSSSALIISLLAGIGALMGYRYWWYYPKKKGMPSTLDSDYRLDWLGV